MPVLSALKTVVGHSRSTYVCRFCNHSFERELSNCPACGCGHVE
ncbi:MULTISPECIES: hypothetical protein [Haloarcula]|nr:hypothetical protein [Halomicroarcula sp. XH51]